MRILVSISVLFFYALFLQAKNEVIDYGHYLCSYYLLLLFERYDKE